MSPQPFPFRIAGAGLWLPGVPTLEAGLELLGRPGQEAVEAIVDTYLGLASLDLPKKDPAVRPPAKILGPRLKRRASLMTKMVAEVLEQAAPEPQLREQVPIILSSGWGELDTTMSLLHAMVDPKGPVSPIAFHNSVHNTATGYLSMATGNTRGSNAIAAGAQGLAMGILEAVAMLQAGEKNVLLAVADEPIPEAFAQGDEGRGRPPMAIGLRLEAVSSGGWELRHGVPEQLSHDALQWPPGWSENPTTCLLSVLRPLLARSESDAATVEVGLEDPLLVLEPAAGGRALWYLEPAAAI